MVHVTHKSWIRLLGGVAVVMTVAMSFAFSNASNALELDSAEKAKLGSAIRAAQCGILAQAMGEPTEVVQVYANIANPYALYQPLIFQAGYITGVIDAQADGLSISHAAAATRLYNRLGCKANVEI